jgi:hypothetical protein
MCVETWRDPDRGVRTGPRSLREEGCSYVSVLRRRRRARRRRRRRPVRLFVFDAALATRAAGKVAVKRILFLRSFG